LEQHSDYSVIAIIRRVAAGIIALQSFEAKVHFLASVEGLKSAVHYHHAP